MTFHLKILNETRHRQALKCDGNSGRLYLFQWHEAVRAYCYQPANQDEVDDLFRTMGRTTGYLFAPVENKGGEVSGAAADHATAPAPRDKGKPACTPETTEHCIARGVIVSEDDDDETAQRLIDAFDKGVNSALLARPRRGKAPPA